MTEEIGTGLYPERIRRIELDRSGLDVPLVSKVEFLGTGVAAAGILAYVRWQSPESRQLISEYEIWAQYGTDPASRIATTAQSPATVQITASVGTAVRLVVVTTLANGRTSGVNLSPSITFTV